MTDAAIHDGCSLLIAIGDPSGVAEARRKAAALARPLGFDPTAAGQLALAVTEIASNIIKHAKRGQLVFRRVQRARELGIEVLALDKGPGIANIAESLRDGHSTAGSPGQGLGALTRMTAGFELFSQPGKGTLARFEMWPKPAGQAASAVSEGAVCLPKAGERVSGDAWLSESRRGRRMLAVVDGLGHGPDAAVASRAALEAAAKHFDARPAAIVEAMHGALRATRGAAAAVAMLQGERCDYCGIGNISGAIVHGRAAKSMVTHNGILGHNVHGFHEFSYAYPAGALCIMHSDGVSARWDLGAYPGLAQRHPALIAAALYRDFGRGRDDATVLVVRNPG